MKFPGFPFRAGSHDGGGGGGGEGGGQGVARQCYSSQASVGFSIIGVNIVGGSEVNSKEFELSCYPFSYRNPEGSDESDSQGKRLRQPQGGCVHMQWNAN